MKRLFIETAVFQQSRAALLSDDEFQQFQAYLLACPDIGDVMVGTGGCRKVRWKRQGKGKSGGVRVIYYHYVSGARLYLLFMYAKNQQDNLSSAQKNALKRVIEQMEHTDGR